MREDFTAGLRAAATPKRRRLVTQPSGTGAPAAATPAPAAAADSAHVIDGRPARIVAVTACATGIAHTFMAADALTAQGGKDGVDLVVEPQGSRATRLDPKVIDARMPSSSPSTSTCASRSASRASRSCAPASSAASSSRQLIAEASPPRRTRTRRAYRAAAAASAATSGGGVVGASIKRPCSRASAT
jgi:PTS system fructose-specific IIC component